MKSRVKSEADNSTEYAVEHADLVCVFIKRLVGQVFSIEDQEMNARTRLSAEVAFARQVAMYVAHVYFGLKHGVVARLFDRDRTTVGYACRLIEDRRDDMRIDFLLECIARASLEWEEITFDQE